VTDAAEMVYAHVRAEGLPVLPVQSFSRPVASDGGSRQDACFRTTRLDPAKIAMGRVYFCQHLTPELVWQPRWQCHPNGAPAIARVVVATGDPALSAALFRALFGAAAVPEQARACIVTAERLRAVPGVRCEPHRVIVPAAAAATACNTMLVFSP
jgi:hypothetical protein